MNSTHADRYPAPAGVGSEAVEVPLLSLPYTPALTSDMTLPAYAVRGPLPASPARRAVLIIITALSAFTVLPLLTLYTR